MPRIPIFAKRFNVKRSKINLARSEFTREQQQLDLETNINQAYNDAEGAATFYEAAKETVEAREITYTNAQKRFNAGVLDSFNFSQIKQRYEAAVSDEVRAKYDYIFKLKVLEFYFGIPLEF